MGLSGTLRQADFRRWLESLVADTPVGRCNSTVSCPLAWYLWGATGEHAVIGTRDYETGERIRRLPKWANTFRRRVDGDGSLWHVITAGEALALLDGRTWQQFPTPAVRS